MNLPKPISLPKPAKMASVKAVSAKVPKIAAVHIQPLHTGIKVTHIMHGAPDQTFAFQSPKKMVSHLKRVEDNAWLRPNTDFAPRITGILDLGKEA